MANAGRRTGFTQEPKLCRFVAKISLANHLERHGYPQIDIERL
jgi:hypothetical protein